ncbi:phospholipase A and acyltransferase 5-like [Cololabis saira]|uniref:phospholipase A and acyltransferase 5-like n=1 Tax=Cololabis saira TaxID=129043 RepID=UPI002AD5ADDD|nr:phospholipase A and acyltransferase 5-like [Cololabis saira]
MSTSGQPAQRNPRRIPPPRRGHTLISPTVTRTSQEVDRPHAHRDDVRASGPGGEQRLLHTAPPSPFDFRVGRKSGRGGKPLGLRTPTERTPAETPDQHPETQRRLSSSSSATSTRKVFDKDKKEAKPGDLIQIFRPGYQHWAVYVGGENVVHFQRLGAAPNTFSFLRFSSGGGVDSGTGIVKKEELKDVVEKNDWTVNNLLDHKYPPRPANDIVKNACSLVNTNLQYNVLEYNCEHFATEMRYGKAESEQPSLLHDGVTLIKIQRFRSADVVPAPLWRRKQNKIRQQPFLMQLGDIVQAL